MLTMLQFLLQLLKICKNYGTEYSVVFNAFKSVWLYLTRRARTHYGNVQFYIDGKEISFVTQYTHLGHVISANMNDRHYGQEEFSLWKVE